MPKVFGRAGTKKLYTNLVGVDGKRRLISTGLEDQRAAERWVAAREREIAAERAKLGGPTGAMTVARWVKVWSNEQCDRSVVDWKRNKGWLETLVVPELGAMLVSDIRTPHLVELFRKIRELPSEATGKPRAPRTIHNIHGVVHTMFNDAELAGHLDHAPKSLDERQLGRRKDANPEWREDALFSRDEVRALISTSKIPWDRRVQYAIELLAGTRPGEVAALRVRHYEPGKAPLGGLRVAKSYSARLGAEKGTKTEAVKHVPVHPTLAAILAEWLLHGWRAMVGRDPEPDDLLIPLPPTDAAARTSKKGEAFRPDYYMRRRWVEEDLPALGWRHRRHYDTRATFVSLAVDDGADEGIIRERVTHTKPMRDGFDYYYRGDKWKETCAEVAKLDVTRLSAPDDNLITLPLAVGADAVLMQSQKNETMSSASGLRRRVSKDGTLAGSDTRRQSKREVSGGRVAPVSAGPEPTASELMQSRCDTLFATLFT